MRGVWLSGGAALALLCALGVYLAPLQPNILALQFAFTPRAFGEVVHQWTGEPLHRFRMHLVADYALLVSYGLFGYLLSTRTQVFQAFEGRRRRWAAWTLPLAAAFDAVENTFHLWLTEVLRFGIAWPYLAAALAASAKWVLLFGFGLAVVLALVRGRASGALTGCPGDAVLYLAFAGRGIYHQPVQAFH
jgi:hypothetical protein